MHLSSGLHPLVYLLLFSEHPQIRPLAAKCFLFPRRQQWAEGQNRLCLSPRFPGAVRAHPPAFPCLPDSSPPLLLFQVGQESVLLTGREAPVDRPPRSQRSPHLHRRQHLPGRHGHHRLSPGRWLNASLVPPARAERVPASGRDVLVPLCEHRVGPRLPPGVSAPQEPGAAVGRLEVAELLPGSCVG